MSASNQPIIIKKIKKGGHGGHHGGSWKVAYADFVTAMMAFFMVMWIMGMSAETRKGIASYFNNPVSMLTGEPISKTIFSISAGAAGKKHTEPTDKDSDREQKSLERTEQKVKAELAQNKDLQALGKNVKVTITPEGLEIDLIEERGAVFFESGSAVIRPMARQIVAHIAPILAKSGKALVVQGHTDAAPLAGPGGNFGLSSARAMSLMQELRADGLPEEQFKEVVGYGSTRLMRPEAPLDFSNRRVTILIPRTAKDGADLPAASLKDKVREGNSPEALDLAPDSVNVRSKGDEKKG